VTTEEDFRAPCEECIRHDLGRNFAQIALASKARLPFDRSARLNLVGRRQFRESGLLATVRRVGRFRTCSRSRNSSNQRRSRFKLSDSGEHRSTPHSSTTIGDDRLASLRRSIPHRPKPASSTLPHSHSIVLHRPIVLISVSGYKSR
jgi:hypothetical protein